MELDYSAIVGAAVTGAIVGATRAWKLWSESRPNPERTAISDAVILDECWNLHDVLNCHSVRVVRSENGGGIPRPGSPAYTTISHEAASKDRRLQSGWQKQVMDRGVVDLWATVAVSKRVLLHVKDLPRGSQARALYEATGVTDAAIYWLGHDRRRRYGFILILNFNANEHPVPDFDGAEYEEMVRHASTIITNELTKYR